MVVTNKRILIPNFLFIGTFKIEIVSKFKLLGILIDNKLNFVEHISTCIKQLNKKLFSIKRLFYLSFAVRLQFFKSFILPSFDFGLSLAIYFSKSALSKLCRAYYNSIYLLLNLKFVNHSSSDINSSLSEYKLMSFQHRITYKLSTFAFNKINNPQSPLKLKEFLAESDRTHIKVLRFPNIIDYVKFSTSYGEKTVVNFYASFFNKIEQNRLLFYIKDFLNYKKFLLQYLDLIVNKLTCIFSNFNITINFSHIYY